MSQTKTERSVARVLHRFPEIVELTETRKRAIAGGRAGIEEALKSMINAAAHPNSDTSDDPGTTKAGISTPQTLVGGNFNSQQALKDQARYAVFQQQPLKEAA